MNIYVSATELENLGWSNVTPDLVKNLNSFLEQWGITTPKRIQIFLGQASVETGRNGSLVEQGSNDRFCGAGYLQLTGEGNYQNFSDYLTSIGKPDPRVMTGTDTLTPAQYVAATYPFLSAGWYWDACNINNIVDNYSSDIMTTVNEVSRIINAGESQPFNIVNDPDGRRLYYQKAHDLNIGTNIMIDSLFQYNLSLSLKGPNPVEYLTGNFPFYNGQVIDITSGFTIPMPAEISGSRGSYSARIKDIWANGVHYVFEGDELKQEDSVKKNGNVSYFSSGNQTLIDIANQQGVTINTLIDKNPGIDPYAVLPEGTEINWDVHNFTKSSIYLNIDNSGTSPVKIGATGENAVETSVGSGCIGGGASYNFGSNDPYELNFSTIITAVRAYAILSNYFSPGAMAITTGYYYNNLWTIASGIGTYINNYVNQELSSVDPLVLDLNGDGVKLTDYVSSPVLFDADHDGKLEATGWVSAQDGIVAVDRNANGMIDDISEVLSEYYGGQAGTGGSGGTKPYKNGFDALKSLDSNNDGVFNVIDTAWSSVKVWVDANHDGKSWNDANNNGVIDTGETSELKTLSELGITSINLANTAQSGLVLDGNEVLAKGSFIQNGQTKEATAANFLGNPNGSTATVSGTGTVVNTENWQATVSAYVAGDGGETIDVAAKGVQNASGGAGNDNLIGDGQDNMLVGGQGSDTLSGGAGNDVFIIDGDDLSGNIHGGDGNDIVEVIGDAGVILNMAQAEVEIAQGGRGDDTLLGGGTSTVYIDGGGGNDILAGGAANDAIDGGDGDDYIDGGFGNDVLRGNRSNDVVYGGADDDYIEGNDGDDVLYGDSGNDVTKGGAGDDYINGGDGADAVEYSGSYSEYRITRTATGVFISDTVAGRDGTDFVENVEKISFKDISLLDLPSGDNVGLGSPLPVKDILTVGSGGNTFDHTSTRTITASQLLDNDIDWQGDPIYITGIYDIQGGTVSTNLDSNDHIQSIQFTPNSSYGGLMGFKYIVADSQGNYTDVIQISTSNTSPMAAAVYLRTPDLPSDPLVVDEWYLSETNILPVWKNYTGKGVKIGQFEPGGSFATTQEVLDYSHYDLKDNIDPDWLAVATKGEQAGEGAEGRYSDHATMVAGVMVASQNGEGTVGVAYDATVAGYWLPKDDIPGLDSQLDKMQWYDVVNNSWSASPNFSLTTQPVGTQDKAYADAVTKGRNGLGTVIVSAAGNDRLTGGNTNYNYNSNNRLEITVGAINATTDLGLLQIGQAPFSSPGANILVSAPGSNVEATSRMIQADNGSIFGADTSTVQGTSFAAPIVSGIVALMLQANPSLGYRDVQEILALSAKKITDPNTTWITNGATNWNGGGMHFSADYGFGEVDARAAVDLAENWITQQTFNNEYSLTTAPSSGTINRAITDGNANGITSSISVTDSGVQIEHTEVRVSLTHANAGDLTVKLIAPNGTTSVLMNRPGVSQDNPNGDTTFAGSNTLDYVFTTTEDWGEDPVGTWSLQVIDANGNNLTGTLNSWSINFYGRGGTANDQYVYTNEYATLAASGGRNVLNDIDGGSDTINAAAIASGSAVNLTTGAATLAGAALTIQNPGNIENIIGGEYNDTLTGNAGPNILAGGRGNDILASGTGPDVLFGDQGNDTLTGGADGDAFIIGKDVGSTDVITDFTVGMDRIVLSGFGASDYSTITFTQVGADTQVNLSGSQTLLVKNVTASALTAGNFVSVAAGVTPRDIINCQAWGFGSDGVGSEMSLPNVSTIYWAGAGGERVFGGTGNDAIYGGLGNDVLCGENSSSSPTGGNDIIYGEAGDDEIYGSGGNDTLYGGTGLDYVNGGAGDDVIYLEGDQALNSDSNCYYINTDETLLGVSYNLVNDLVAGVSGGAGNDRFVVVEDTSALTSLGVMKNLICDFDTSNPNEKIDLSQIRAVKSFSDLYFNNFQVDGDHYLRVWLGPMAVGTQYITLYNTSQSQLLAANFIFAADGANPSVSHPLLQGTSGNDYLIGDAGGQTLDGGAGADTMEGCTGDDTYIVGNTGDIVIEQPDGGYDTVKASVTYTLPGEVEDLELTGTASINGTGNSLANRMYGNSGDNVLDGGGGSDAMIGGAGNDTYIVDDGADRVIENAGEGTDTVQSSVSFTLGDNLENLTLTGTDAINATGNALANVLTGNAADNKLDGAQGADTLSGGAGDDVYLIDNTGDVIIENPNEGIDTVYSAIDYTIGANIENLILANSVVSGTGNELDNEITGNAVNNILSGATGNDWLNGGIGADTMIGGTDDDIFVVDSTGDIVVENADEGLDTVLSGIAYTLGANVENLALTGTDNLSGTGNSLANILIGNSGNNVLTGGAGNDILDGGTGPDTLIGGTGNDTYFLDDTNDVMVENTNEGTDTVETSFSYTLGANFENLTLTGSDNLSGTGNSFDNVITGNYGDNILTGGAGNDTYVVDSTGDIVIENVGEGIDTVQSSIAYTLGANVENLTLTGTAAINGTGNSLNNVIIGNSGDNVLDGGVGADTLAGGLGNDTYIVDSSDLIVTENADEGTDTVQAGFTYTLGANIENLILTGTAAINGTGNSIANSITGNSGNNVLNGGAGNDTLAGGLGDDTYIYGSGSGNDTIYSYEGTGGNGNDTVRFETGLTSSSLNFRQNGQDLVVQIQAGGETLTFTNWFNGDNYQVDTFLFADNSTLTAPQVTTLATSGGANKIIGTTGQDTLIGGVNADIIFGMDGNDILDGGAGADTLLGGTGNDSYVVDNTGDVVTESAGEGVDTVQAGVTYTLGANVENLTLTGTAAINGIGNSLDNVITGNSGSNILTGGAGNDSYVVDSVGDVVTENAGEGVDTVQAGVTYTLGANVENLTLTGTAAINGTGNSLDNVITGNRGINGLDGGAGADTLLGGAGNDSYVVDNAGDVVTENAGEGVDIVQAGVTYTLGANIENLTLTGTTDLNGTGNNLDNVLTGNRGINVLIGGLGNDTLDGGVGNDTMIGGAGNDTYIVDSDVITERAGEGIDTVQASFSYILGDNLENLTLVGDGQENLIMLREYLGIPITLDSIANFKGIGNNLANIITGTDDDNVLIGGAGADTLLGGAGNDTYVVDNSSDVVTENSGEGTDIIQASTTYTLGANIENLTLTGMAAINGTGNSLDNVITGNQGDNVLDGGAGADTLVGGAGNDTYLYGISSDNDVIVNEKGNSSEIDVVSFGPGITEDMFGYSQSGANLWVSLGSNSLIIENWFVDDKYKVDTFRFADGTTVSADDIDGNFPVYTWTGDGGDDILRDEGYSINIFNGMGGNDSIWGNEYSVNQVYGGDGNDYLEGGLSNSYNLMYGEAGNDWLSGGRGSSYNELHGGAGNDQLGCAHGSDNVNHLYGDDGDDFLVGGSDYNNQNFMYGGDGNDTLASSTYSDPDSSSYLEGGNGEDNYEWAGGNVTINNFHTDISSDYWDQITFAGGFSADVEYSQDNADLICTDLQTGQALRIQNAFMGPNYQQLGFYGEDVEQITYQFADYVYITDSNAQFNYSDVYTRTYEFTSEAYNDTLVDQSFGVSNYLFDSGAYGNTVYGGDFGYGGFTFNSDATDNYAYGGDYANDIFIFNSGAAGNYAYGGTGDNTFIWCSGAGNDTIWGGSGQDTLQFQNIVLDSIAFTSSGSGLICTDTQTGQNVTVANWLSGSTYQIESFQFADHKLTSAQVSQRIA